MFRPNSTRWMMLLVVAFIIAVGVTGSIDNHPVTTQTAIGQSTNDDFSEDFQYLERANRAFIEVVNRAKPSVVQITTTKLVSVNRSRSPFDDFFYFGPRRERGDRGEPDERQEVQSGLGSGVVVSDDGYILTNNHVIEGAEGIVVILPNGREYDAEVVGRDSGEQGTDLAVLKIDGANLPVLAFGDSDELQVGEWVIAVGSPFGLAQTVTRGMVSAKGRSKSDISIVEYSDFIQTDTAINKGNSGGALINIRGELVGINTAIATGGGFSQGNVGVGFAIPINLAKRVMTDLIEKGEVQRGWLGVSIQSIDQDLAEKLRLDTPQGVLVTEAYKDMPAYAGGIRRGDVIVEFDGTPIRDLYHLRNVVAITDVGKQVEVKVIRKGKEKRFDVQLGKQSKEVLASLQRNSSPGFVPDEEDAGVFSGLYVENLTDEYAQRYSHAGEKGVIVVRVERRSPAAIAGIREGDLIQEVEDVEVTNVREYRKRVQQVKDGSLILLSIRRANGVPAYVTLKNPQQDK